MDIYLLNFLKPEESPPYKHNNYITTNPSHVRRWGD